MIAPELTESDLAACLAALAPALIARAEEGVVIKDAASGLWRHVNEPMAQWLGQRPADLIGRTNAEHFGQAAAALLVAEQRVGSEAAVADEHAVELGGTRREFSVLRRNLHMPDGQQLMVAIWHDLGPQRRREAQLRTALEQLEQQQQANEALRKASAQGQTPRDSDTGLHNRAHFDDQLRREVDLSTREHREFALVFIDIDPLTDDALAAGAGPRLRVLEAIGRLLRSNTRAMDASCRLGDNRFAVLLSGVGLATAHSRMEGLRRQCATQIVVHEGREIGFTVSMGVASFPHTAQTQDELLQISTAAVDDARQRGGNRVALASILFGAG